MNEKMILPERCASTIICQQKEAEIGILWKMHHGLAINLGYGLWWTTLVPFLSYGRISAVMNGIYIGFILSVYRNSSILWEESIPQERLPKIRVVIE